jgi:hypothetical protein
LSELQSILGDANDGFVGCNRVELLQHRLPQLFRKLWPRWSPLFEKLQSEFRQTMQEARERFEGWKQKAAQDQLKSFVCALFNSTALQGNPPVIPLPTVHLEAV